MKKILLTLVVLLLATPAWADVIISAELDVDDTGQCTVVVSYDATTEANLVRAFSLDIKLDNDANIVAVTPTMVGACTEAEQGYGIFPGSIMIDAQGEVQNYGTAVAEYGDLTSDTLPGLDSNGVTIEMASLYAPVGPASPNAPAASGDLLTFKVDAPCIATITANVSRAGASGVVMEDPDEVVTVVLPAPLDIPCPSGPPCWYEGQLVGDASADCVVNFADLVKLRLSWLKSDGDPDYDPCADFSRDGVVNFADLVIMRVHWLQNVCP
jgi:hypothetical protein